MKDPTLTTDNELSSNTPILIVEDTAGYAKLLEKILSSGLGFKQITVVNSIEAARNIITATPDYHRILFVDYMFPNDETGAEFLARLKQQDLLKRKISFLITAHPDVEKVQAAANLGVNGLLVKPFDRIKLQNLLERAADLLRD